LRRVLSDLDKPLSLTDGVSIYSSQINFCVKKINSGVKEYLNELFALYKELIRNGYILTNGKISPTTYINVAVTALRNEEYNWAQDFISEYAKFLPSSQRENLPKYQLSRVYFYKKEFGKVIELLRDFEMEDVIDNLQAKSLLLQTYYELKEIDALDSLLKSLKTYIVRHKEIDPGRRKNYKNLIKLITQLMSIIPGNQKKIDKLRLTISEMKGIAANREWLEEKIQELEKRR